MENNRDILTWNRKTGEIVFLQQVVQDSNIIELLKGTLTGNLHPLGKMEFYRGLIMLKVKLSCIKHPKNKGLLITLKGDWKIVNKKSSGKKIKSVKHRSVWISSRATGPKPSLLPYLYLLTSTSVIDWKMG